MKKQIIQLLSQGLRVTICFVNGEKLTFSNINNQLNEDNLIELNDGENSINFIVNTNHICYIKPYVPAGIKAAEF